jgi:hypothetical protein
MVGTKAVVMLEGKPCQNSRRLDIVKTCDKKDPKWWFMQITSAPLIAIDPDEDLLKASEMMQARSEGSSRERWLCHLRRDHLEYRPEVQEREQVYWDVLRWSFP